MTTTIDQLDTPWEQLQAFLNEGEEIEAVVFGPFGWGDAPDEGEEWELGWREPESPLTKGPIVPFNERGKILSPPHLARFYMSTTSWTFKSGYGSPNCYAVYVWTNQRVIWVTQYDGSTRLCGVPRNPQDIMPEMPGG